MILVDTSVWIDHLRTGNDELVALLNDFQVMMHPYVVGEIACRSLKNRKEVLGLLQDLPGAKVATDAEVLYFIENHALMGRGIGYVDAHLLAATALSTPARLWTHDRKLGRIANDLELA